MQRLLVLCALLCASVGVILAQEHTHPHPDDPVKRDEHLAALRLVNEATAIQATGLSSALAITPTSDLYVPAGSEFTIDGNVDFRRLKFDGIVRITDKAATIRFETIVGNTNGQLIVPLSSAQRRFVVKARGPRDRVGDPTDVTGGIILHSTKNSIIGGPKTAMAVPTAIAGNVLTFGTPVVGWKAGDQILVPGQRMDQTDEVGIVSAVENGGSRVVLTAALTQNHVLPSGLYQAVGNMSQTVVIESENPNELSQRGHVMVMHEHTGTTFSNVLFWKLGRTTVEATPTRITLGPDGEFVAGDENTIGRYPLHFHGRNGALKSVSPHMVNDCVVVNSPTHGFVNHGSHVSFRGNVSYDCAGSNFFGENGMEIGDFTNNLAVLSRGRQSPADAAAEGAKHNFGWEGNCLWLQGPGMDVVGNHLYRAKKALIEFNFTMLPDGGGQFSYPIGYVRPGPHRDAIAAGKFGHTKTHVGIFQVPFLMDGNIGAGSVVGIQMVHSMYDTKSSGNGRIETKIYSGEKSKIHNMQLYNVDAAMRGTYIAHLDIRNCRFEGNLKLINWWAHYTGTPQGTKVHDVFVTNCEFRRFQIAIVDRGWSDYYIDGCTFEDNLVDMQIICRSNIMQEHIVKISNCTHLGRPNMEALYKTMNPKTVWATPKNFWFHEQFPERLKTYDANYFFVSPHTLDDRLLFYPMNNDAFVPFSGVVGTGSEFNDLNNKQLFDQFGKSVGGRHFDNADPEFELLTIDANIPIYVEKMDDPPPPPPPLTLEERVEQLELRVKVLESSGCKCGDSCKCMNLDHEHLP